MPKEPKSHDYAQAFGRHLARIGYTEDRRVRQELARYAIDAGMPLRLAERFIALGARAWQLEQGNGTTTNHEPVVATRAEGA